MLYKIKYKYVFLFSLLIISVLSSLAQERDNSFLKKSNKTEIINGKKYYIHTTEKGQTLYSISKAYEVAINDILMENPEIMDGLKTNQIIKIPANKKDLEKIPPGEKTGKKDNSLNNLSYIEHTVESGETFYGLSKKYGVSIESIKLANPQLEENLKAGIKVQIPLNSAVPVDTIGVALKSSNDTTTYKVALLLPFYLSVNGKKQTSGKNEIYFKSYTAIEFYEGFMVAVDSMKELGLNMQLFVYDAPNDAEGMQKFLNKPELKEMNLIIGPFHSDPVAPAAEFAKKNEIPIVAPFSQQSKVLLGNSFVSKVTPSTITQLQKIAEYIAKTYTNQNILLLYADNKEKEKSLAEIFAKKVKSLLNTDTISEIIYNKVGVKGLTGKLSTHKNNVIFVPSTEQAFVIDLLNKIKPLSKEYNFTLIGMKNWLDFDNLNIDLLEKLQVFIPTPTFINYEDQSTKHFITKYRERYKTEPSSYAFHGYDIGIYYLKALMNYGIDFEEKLPILQTKGLHTQFNFYKTAVESGYENQSLYILKYHDYSLIQVN